MIRGLDYIGITVLCYCCTEDGQWVVHRRARRCKTPGVFNFVTGKLELGEQPIETAYREVREEYGCTPMECIFLEPHTSIVENKGTQYHWLVLPFFCRVNSGDIRPNPREVEDLTFIQSLDDIPEPRHDGVAFSLSKSRRILEELAIDRDSLQFLHK